MNDFLIKIKKIFFDDGLVFIFGSSVFAQLCGLISSIFVIRGLPKAEYGDYVQASNLYSYVAIFIGMGFTAAVLQFCSEPVNEEKKNAIYRYTLVKGSLFNFILAVTICFMSNVLLFLGHEAISAYLLLMCGYPILTYLYSYIQVILRVKRNNVKFASVNIIYSFLLLVFNILLSRWFGVKGLIMAYYLACLITVLVGIFFGTRSNFFSAIKKTKEVIYNRKEIVKYSLTCSVTNFAYGILLLIDVTCIGILVSDKEVLADYKVGAALPAALVFISDCLMTFYYPQIVEHMYNNSDTFRPFLKRLFWAFGSINLFIFVVTEFMADFIICGLYGNNYSTAIPIFRLLLFNFLLSATVRKIMGNLIAIIKDVHINLIHCIISGVLNIFLDVVLIKHYGSKGAALATTICTIFMTLLEIIYISKKLSRKSGNKEDN